MKCMKHPRYQGKRLPRILCEGCWAKWFHEKADREWKASPEYRQMKQKEEYYARCPEMRFHDEWINSPG